MENITAPPLDLDLNSVDTSMPLIADGSIVDLQIDKVTKKDTKTPGVAMLALDFKTVSPSKAQDNADLGAGIHVFHNLILAPSGKATWDMVARNIAAVTQAAGLATTYGELVANPNILQGQTVRAKLKVIPEGVDKTGKSYRAKNEVSVFMKVS